jgi:uncharacterized delta-60 repeat protein
MALQTDGKIVVCGYSVMGANTDFTLVRYNADGSIDSTFSNDGKTTTDFGSSDDIAYSVNIQNDGKIVAAGQSFTGSNYDFALARYNADGTLDNSFSSDGKLTTAMGSGDDYIYSSALQADGKIVVAGYTYGGSNSSIALARYNTDGTLDNSFSSDGKVTTAIGSSSGAKSVALQSDGKIVVAGYSASGTNNLFTLARYLSVSDIGVDVLPRSENMSFIFPNPASQNATLEYTLQESETVSVFLSDLHGKMINKLLDKEVQEKGKHILTIVLPEEISPGFYFINLSSESRQEFIKLLKF